MQHFLVPFKQAKHTVRQADKTTRYSFRNSSLHSLLCCYRALDAWSVVFLFFSQFKQESVKPETAAEYVLELKCIGCN